MAKPETPDLVEPLENSMGFTGLEANTDGFAKPRRACLPVRDKLPRRIGAPIPQPSIERAGKGP